MVAKWSLCVWAGLFLIALPAHAAQSGPPPSWLPEPSVSLDDCSKLAGTYLVSGERDPQSAFFSIPRDLTDLVFSPWHVAGATNVSVAFVGGDSVRFIAWSDTTALRVRTLSLDRHGVECVEGVLQLPSVGFSNDALIGVSRARVSLQSGNDGMLIAESKVTIRGLAYLLFPMWSSSVEWYRFRQR